MKVPRLAKVAIAYAVAILVLSSADLSYQWRAHSDGSSTIVKGFGLGAGYWGVWALKDDAPGLRARLHRPDFGFAGVTLITHLPPDRLFLVAPWAVLVIAGFGHVGWVIIRHPTGLTKIMRRRNRIILVASAGVLMAWFAGYAIWNRYAFPKWLQPLRTRYQEKVSRIRIDDGVDSTEAMDIAGLYMGEYISGCGAPEPPTLRGGKWTVPLRIGYTGALSDYVIEINAETGAVASNAGPGFPSFQDFTDDLIGGIGARRR